MTKPFVAILMGSDTDFPVVEEAVKILKKFQIPLEVKVTSAHRTPTQTQAYVQEADQRGCAVFVAAAGMAAHLAGTVAALTIKPVIGIPIDAGPLQGFDALLSTAQMPGGIPVATVAIGRAGAKNAGYLAAQILALNDAGIALKLKQEREANAVEIQQKNVTLQKQLPAS